MRSLLRLSPLFFLLYLASAPELFGQSPPADFLLRATTGGTGPSSITATITINAQGQARYISYDGGELDTTFTDTTFSITQQALTQLWQAIQASGFPAVDTSSTDSTFTEGTTAKITLTANGVTSQVMTTNAPHQQIQSILSALNAALPPPFQLQYVPPTKFDIIPREPCGPLFGSAARTFVPPTPKFAALIARRDLAPPPAPPHPGTVVAYAMSLADAIRARLITLKSKGAAFGDAISVILNNKNPPPPPPKATITVTLYIEFWGPDATPANIAKVVNDIVTGWNGHTTSSGQPVEVNVVARADRNATSPPGTPGYNEIQLVPYGTVRSFVNKPLNVNQGVNSGTWEVGLNKGGYAHEAGHLMGLEDQYDDFQKLGDGTWLNKTTGDRYTADQLTQKIAAKRPDLTPDEIRDLLSKWDQFSLSRDGFEHDIMGKSREPVSQRDIDAIAAHPGLLVTIPDGSVVTNKNKNRQSLIVTHTEDVFAGPGQVTRLNGIYGACIDNGRGTPDSSNIFDLVPPVSQWRGIAAADYLARLISYVDSARLFCDFSLNTQFAVWRLTDNSRISFGLAGDTLLTAAGINIGNQALDFPRLNTLLPGDTVTSVFVPNELYAADIEPYSSSGSVGGAAPFTASVNTPTEGAATPSFSWLVYAPDGSVTPANGSGSSLSFTPAGIGVYRIGLSISVTDSVAGQRSFPSLRRAYLVVPDSLTETFEQGKIPDRFPWRNTGNVPWTVNSVNPQTGSFAAQPGDLSQGGTAVLAIDVSLSQPAFLSYNVRTATTFDAESCTFSIDSTIVSTFTGITDWVTERVKVPAGKHTLSWAASGGASSSSNFWLDNVFFPPGSVVTAVAELRETIPTTFSLSQNYPNPFNPTTTIRYGLPHAAYVTLVVYDALGRRVAELVDGTVEAGYHEVKFDGRNLASGVYFYKLEAAGFVQVRKLMIIR